MKRYTCSGYFSLDIISIFKSRCLLPYHGQPSPTTSNLGYCNNQLWTSLGSLVISFYKTSFSATTLIFWKYKHQAQKFCLFFFPEILDLTYDAVFHLAPNFTPWMSSQYFSWKERSTNTELLSSILPNFMPLWFYSSYYLCLGSPFSSSFLKSPKHPLWNQSYLSSTEHILGVRDCAKHLQYKR